MSAPSFHSSNDAMAGYTKRMTQIGHPDMEILLDNHTDGQIYTTLDAISGKVEITAPHHSRFDEIQITLEGSVRTWVESISPASTKSKTTALHNFLKLRMPISQEDYPQPRIAEAGRTYSFPFNFVVPEQLLPRSCTHKCSADHVHLAHLQLPPSFGDREVDVKDDLAPQMSKIVYAIKVKVMRSRETDGGETTLVEGLRKLHIIPAQPEAPPMNITSADKDYVLSKTKTMKKGVFSGKLGRITATAAQTGALTLPPPSSTSSGPATTMAKVQLQFHPQNSESQPPRLGAMNSKIRATTFFTIRPAQEFPTRSGMSSQYEPTRSVYETAVHLNSRCIEGVSWTRHSVDTRRKNSASSCSSSSCSDSESPITGASSGVYYTATLLVPITLPSAKRWVPTFHSCIASRTYTIDLTLTIHTPGTAVPATNVKLHLPVQIAAASNGNRQMALTAAEAAQELADADEYLRPRVIEMPRDELVGTSALGLPPSYEDFSTFSRRPAVVDPGRG